MFVTIGATLGIPLCRDIRDSSAVQVWSLVALLAGVAAVPLGRFLVRRHLGKRRARRELLPRVLVLGAPRSVEKFCESLARSTPLGYSVTGVCMPRFEGELGSVLETAVGRVPVLGNETSVELALQVTGADALAVTSFDEIDPTYLRTLAWTLDSLDVDMVLVPGLMDIAASRVKLRPINDLPAVRIDRPRYDGAPAFGKRLFDITVGLAALVATAPVLLLAAVAIKLDDGGPVIFRQTRVGHRGRTFRIFKFRTMTIDADARKEAERAVTGSSAAVFFKSACDSRVTRVGRLLRATSIDELPQLFNVLGGSMSLVGPRPLVVGEGASVDHYIERRGLLKPGMTGLWQVSGRSDVSDEERVRLDHCYIDNWSGGRDLAIIMATVRAVLKRKGAY
jgi:exopolysaccharide biosynthesis polyprenyl glycosylphosphotransferase